MRERERSNARDDDDDGGYFSLDQLTRYSGLSRSSLRRYLKDPTHPLPCHRVGVGRGRLLIAKAEFDAWVREAQPAAATDDAPIPGVSWIKFRD